MSFDPGLTPGDVVSSEELNAIFDGQRQGGIRRSHSTNTLLVVSNHTTDKPFYDRWDESHEVFHYTAQGPEGDQSLDWNMNPVLLKADDLGLDVFLFEVFEPARYTYMGPVELADAPYQEQQADVNLNMRIAWVFPLQIKGGGSPTPVSEASVRKAGDEREKQIRKRMSGKKLRDRAMSAPKTPSPRPVVGTQYERDGAVAEYVKERARGECDLCGEGAPFARRDGSPYLEAHHVKWIARGGDDSIENAVALCPNCHAKMHVLDRAADVQHLKSVLGEYSRAE